MVTRSHIGSLWPKMIFNISSTFDISPIPHSTAQALWDLNLLVAMDFEMHPLRSNHSWDIDHLMPTLLVVIGYMVTSLIVRAIVIATRSTLLIMVSFNNVVLILMELSVMLSNLPQFELFSVSWSLVIGPPTWCQKCFPSRWPCGNNVHASTSRICKYLIS